MRVVIATGFAAGLEGEAHPLGTPEDGFSVTVAYPDGFSDGVEDLSGQADQLWYGLNELEFLKGGE